MYYIHLIIVLFFTFASSLISTDVTYDELVDLGATCNGLDTCKGSRTADSLDQATCHCGSFCSKLRSCCVDSPYRDIKLPGRRPNCRPVNGENGHYYYIVDFCSSNHNKDKEMERLCKEELKEQDNLTPMLPVTSLASNVTYKNYYCLRCNEETDDFLYWNVQVKADIKAKDAQSKDVVLTYDTVSKTWMAPVGEGGVSIPVSLFFDIPSEIKTVPKICIRNVTSTCSGRFQDRDVKRKCGKYTAFMYVKNNNLIVWYRNPHCALCNFEDLENMGCGVASIGRTTAKRPFSLTLLLDINRSDGDKVGEVQKCDDKSTWDPDFKKCREYVCLFGQVVKNGKCVNP